MPPRAEISAITSQGQRLALMLESPEPLVWTRLACKLQVLKSLGVYTDLKNIPQDGTKVLLLLTARPSVQARIQRTDGQSFEHGPRKEMESDKREIEFCFRPVVSRDSFAF